MTLQEYQAAAHRTAVYPNVGRNITYPTLGLAGEAGEVANKVKKILRDGDGTVDAATKAVLVRELGDVLWYVAELAAELGVTLEEVAAVNIEKLAARQAAGRLSGAGDER